jgi:hypothetical protein
MSGTRMLLSVVVASLVTVSPMSASGSVGLYGIVEKVVFEPSKAAPERVQVWGVFAYANVSGRGGASAASRGYLYFKLPTTGAGMWTTELVRREWADLDAVSGSGQPVAFGQWGLLGNFAAVWPQVQNGSTPDLYEGHIPSVDSKADVRVRPASEVPAGPATYQTNVGVVRLAEQGSHADIVASLRARLR